MEKNHAEQVLQQNCYFVVSEETGGDEFGRITDRRGLEQST